MLHFNTIVPRTLTLLDGLMEESMLESTRLVGGTALALQLGHRTSVDLDLFGHISCDDIQLRKMLASHGQLQVINMSRNVKLFTIDGIKVDIVDYDSEWIDEIVRHDHLRLASVPEIAAMKIRAIIGRGTRKDFVDLYYLLQIFSLDEIMALFKRKYPDVNDFIAIRSLAYFEDAEQSPMPMMIDQSVEWESMKTHILHSLNAII